MNRITIKDMAAHFHISTAAVSKALNDLPGVSEDLRREIKDFAKANNYIPNMFGRGLKGNQLKVIGLIISDNTNPVYSRQIKSIESEANKFGYNIVLCNSDESIEKEKLHLETMVQKNVNGIIAVPSDSREYKHFQQVMDMGIPLVFLNRCVYNCNASVFKADHRKGAYLAVEYLIKKGYKKILHCTVDQPVSTVYEKIQGFREALEANGLSFSEDDIYYSKTFDRQAIYKEMLSVLRNKNSYNAIFAFNDSLALSVIKAANELGVNIPNDIAVLGYDESEYNEICYPPLSSVAQDVALFGKDAVDCILRKISGEDNASEIKEYLPLGIIEREST